MTFLDRIEACKRAAIRAQNPEFKLFWSETVRKLIDSENKRLKDGREGK